MSRIVHTTDTYLDRRNMGRRQRQDDYVAAFEAVVDRAVDVSADAVLHTGNLFWTQSPDRRIVDECRRVLERAADADVEVHLLYGSRDLKITDLLSELETDGLLTRLTPRWNRIGDVAVFAHDATEGDPESGYHYPPDDVTARVAAVHDDVTAATRHDDIASYESAVGWTLDGVLVGNRSQPVRETERGVEILSPGQPERVIGKVAIDQDRLRSPKVFQYDVSPDGIEVTAHEIDARPVTGFRIDLPVDATIADVRDALAGRELEGTATVVELTGEAADGSLDGERIKEEIAGQAAVARVYDERSRPADAREPGAAEKDGSRPRDGSGVESTADTSPAARSASGTERPRASDGSSGGDRLVVFGHVGGDGEILDLIAAATADEAVDAYVYTGTNRAIPGGATDDSGASAREAAFGRLAEQAPVYAVPDETVSVWTADTDEYAPPVTPRDDPAVPDAVEPIPFDGYAEVGSAELTRNPWLRGESSVLVTHRARPQRWHGDHAAYVAGGHLVGRRDRRYLNAGFASFDPGVGRDLLHGQYFEVTVDDGELGTVTWHPLGMIEELTCPDHEEYGRLTLLEGLECPFCAMEGRDRSNGNVETPTTVYERAYLVASDDLPARRAHQVAYFDRPEVTRPDGLTNEQFPPAVDTGQAELDERALAAGDLRGELMYFLDPADADHAWLEVRDLVSRGEIYDARVSTAFTRTARGDGRHLLLVAVPNYADVADAHRVHRRLISALDFEESVSVKPTLYTTLGIYSSNAEEWGLSRSTRYTLHADEEPIGLGGLPESPAVEPETFPADVRARDRWLLWKPEPDGRKIPRAPWETGDDAFVSAMNPDNWTTYENAAEYCEMLSDDTYGLAFSITDEDPFVLLDYDDARDPDTGRIAPTVRQHIEDAGSYADVSTSGTGVHLLVRGALSEDVASIVADLPEHDFSLEVYDSDRYAVMTGDHLAGTPAETTNAQELLDRLEAEHATRRDYESVSTSGPTRPREELADIEETTDIDDVFDAIEQVRPGDIRLHSTVTEERADGTKSLDPSWTASESGTRLGQLDDVWVYRNGMYVLDALQVVALEERLLTRVDSYPSGETFWQAVDALRERGAHVPEYTRADD